MEKLIKTVGESVDRRWFLRMLGKLGMGAAAVAGVVLLPRQASAVDTPCTMACDATLKGCQRDCRDNPTPGCRSACKDDHHACISGC